MLAALDFIPEITLTTALIVIPLIAALGVLVCPPDMRFGRFPVGVGPIALVIALVQVVLWILAVRDFDFSAGSLNGIQLAQEKVWFEELGVAYSVGLTGPGLWLVGLTVVVMACAIAYAVWAGRDRGNAYYALMLFLTAAIVGVFTAQDLLLFYAFFEAMLIPLYVLVGVWGGRERLRATLKFVVYTMVGSLLMLAAILAYGIEAGTFSLMGNPESFGPMLSGSTWLFLGFMLAFAIKAPLFPFHGWLPDAYRQASPEVAAILSGVVSKAAAYAFLRIVVQLFPEPVAEYRTYILVLAAIGLVYGSLLAFRAPDFRGVVAYSSLAQMGLITLGVFAQSGMGWNGAVLQMVNQGLISAALFLLAGTVEQRTGTGELAQLGGMARGRPRLATIVLVVGVIALAVPLSASFAGEFLILAGVFERGWGYAVVGGVAIVLAAMYVLRLVTAVLHREVGPAVPGDAPDLRVREVGILLPLVGLLIALSVWPAGVSQHSFGDPIGDAPFELPLGGAAASAPLPELEAVGP